MGVTDFKCGGPAPLAPALATALMLLRSMLKFKRLACGSEDVTQYNTIKSLLHTLKQYKVCLKYTMLLRRKNGTKSIQKIHKDKILTENIILQWRTEKWPTFIK